MIRNSPTLVDNLIKQNQDLETIQSELDVYVEEEKSVPPILLPLFRRSNPDPLQFGEQRRDLAALEDSLRRHRCP